MSEYASARRSATSGPRRRHTSALQYASSDHRASSRAALQSTTPLMTAAMPENVARMEVPVSEDALGRK